MILFKDPKKCVSAYFLTFSSLELCCIDRSVQFSRSVASASLWPRGCGCARQWRNFSFFLGKAFWFFWYLFYLFICARSSLPRSGFLYLRWAGAPLHCSIQASHCCGSSRGAQALGAWTSAVTACGLVVAAPRLYRADSVVMVHGLRCSVAFCVRCIGRWILIHCATREVIDFVLFCFLNLFYAVISSIKVALDSCFFFSSVSL